MKTKIILFFAILVSMLSCNNIKEVRDIKGRTFEQIVEDELKTGQRNDSIFMGFKFGMSENEVNEHFNKILKKKKIYTNYKKQYCYDFVLGQNEWEKLTATFSTDYFDKKLYLYTLIIRTDHFANKSKAGLSLQTANLWQLFERKYGFKDLYQFSYKEEDLDYPYAIWVKGNRCIEIRQGIYGISIIYTDLISQKSMEKNNMTKADTLKQNNIKDI